MINFKQTDIQKRIECIVTNGLGFDSQTKYLENQIDFYKNNLEENEIKNTQKGLDAHLAEMDLDKQTNDIYKRYFIKGNFFKKLKGKINYFKILNRNDSLKNKAVKSIVEEKGGLWRILTDISFQNYVGQIIVYLNNSSSKTL